MAISVMTSLWLVISPNIEEQPGGVVSDHVEELPIKVDLEEGIVALSAFSPRFSADTEVEEAP